MPPPGPPPPNESEQGINIILFGPPGAGKGTQAKRLQARFNLPIVASGDLFREMAREDTPLAQQVRGYMARGEYVPDEVTIEMVMERLSQADAARGFILDGFPRTLAQATALDEHLAERNRHVDVAVWINAPRDVLVARLGGRLICPVCNSIYNLATKPPKNDMLCDLDGTPLQRRVDEETETITTRLETYQNQTQPLIEYYRARGLLKEIDGARPFEEVEAAIDAAVEEPSISQ